mgnify:CR=1
MIIDILDGKPSTARDIAILNAGAAIYVSGLSNDLKTGVQKAATVVDDGSAKNKLQQLIKESNKYG